MCVNEAGVNINLKHLGGTDIQAGNQSFWWKSARNSSLGGRMMTLSFGLMVEESKEANIVTLKGWTLADPCQRCFIF